MAGDLLFCHFVRHEYIFRWWLPMGKFGDPQHHNCNERQSKMSSKICLQTMRFWGLWVSLWANIACRNARRCLTLSALLSLVNFPLNASTVKLRPRRVCKIWNHIPSGLKVSTRGNRSWVPPIHIARPGLPTRLGGYNPPSA